MKLKELRTKFKISQTELAKQVNISQKSISNYENGISDPDIKTLKQLADYFHTTVDDLIDHKFPYFINKNVLTENKSIKIKLKELRLKNNLTQEDIAKKINKSAVAYGYYESGRNEPDIQTLIRLANFYNITIDYLVGNEIPYFSNKNDYTKNRNIKLKELRLKHEKTQQEIAKDLNLTQNTYSNYEKGKTTPDIQTLIKIADYFHVTVDYLIGHEVPYLIDKSYYIAEQQILLDEIATLDKEKCKLTKAYIDGINTKNKKNTKEKKNK